MSDLQTTLLKCPFCGGQPIWQAVKGGQAVNFDLVYRVNCSECYRIDMPYWSDQVDCVKQWNARAPQAEEWQPIETAPHETHVLLGWWYVPPWKDSAPRWETEVGSATHGWSRNGVSTLSKHGSATHWAALPAPPDA